MDSPAGRSGLAYPSAAADAISGAARNPCQNQFRKNFDLSRGGGVCCPDPFLSLDAGGRLASVRLKSVRVRGTTTSLTLLAAGCCVSRSLACWPMTFEPIATVNTIRLLIT